MKSYLIFFLLLITTTLSYSQNSIDEDNYAKSWPEDQLRDANVNKRVEFMSHKERDVIFLCNLARINGRLFIKTVLKPYLVSKNMKSNHNVKSLIKTLNKQKPLPVLEADRLLYRLALGHAKTSGQRGTIGHDGFMDRLKKANKDFPNVAENIYYGKDDAMEIALEMLIDNGVAKMGHRKNMLNPVMGYIGVSIQPHKSVYEYNCVMEFGGKQ